MATGLNREYLDTLDLEGYCPGFRLWDALATDGTRYLVASDSVEGVSTRLYMRSHGAIDLVSADCLGDNPDAIAWKTHKGTI